MNLEKIVNIAKISPVEVVGQSLLVGLLGSNVATIFQTGSVSIGNIALFVQTGIVAVMGQYAISRHIKEYEEISQAIKQYGFNNDVLSNNKKRWFARIYARENSLLDEYNNALKDYIQI